MRPVFLLQIVKPDGAVVQLPEAGGRLERDLIAVCTRVILKYAAPAIVAEGVGFLKTEAQVTRAIETGLPQAVERGITEVIHDLKWETEPLVNKP